MVIISNLEVIEALHASGNEVPRGECSGPATVNNSSDTESIPSPRTEAAKEAAQNGPKPPPTPGADAPPPEPPSPPPEDAPAPSEPAPAPEAACPPTSPPAPASPAAAPAVVPKEEKEEEAAAAPSAEEGEEQKPPAAPELAADVGKTEEPGEAPPSEPIKSECKEEAAEEGPGKVKGTEAAAEAAPEGALQVEKKEGGPGGKGPAAKGSGAPQDSDSSATCSADEVDEPEGGDKNRLLSPRPSLLTPTSDARTNASPQKPLDLKQLKQRAAAIPPIVSPGPTSRAPGLPPSQAVAPEPLRPPLPVGGTVDLAGQAGRRHLQPGSARVSCSLGKAPSSERRVAPHSYREALRWGKEGSWKILLQAKQEDPQWCPLLVMAQSWPKPSRSEEQVTKAHEPPREDAAPPKPAAPAPPPPQHLQPESDSPQQPGSSPRGKSRSPVPPAEKEAQGQVWAAGATCVPTAGSLWYGVPPSLESRAALGPEPP
ncbi:hypothetical protein J1605_012714 [Eschrichtius robustus]|uniref:Uncharacterized protein n=1 Tax=Eschrichtius robustus TaxID=9764 RepID=A0AB34GG76_ESCRO|nr:hypothetical protein J1605_012714 [Eschrichtius robustus]